MSRIKEAFARARAQNRAAFIAYLCAGDPDFETSLCACRAVVESGADILELGVPFSDPLADGLTNQLAAQRALEAGMTSARVFELVRRIRESSEVPIVFYTYYNLVFSNGVDAYVRAARAAGVDGMLTLDLPPEEAQEVAAASRAHGLDTVCIVAPTTPDSRLPMIAAAATGFIYYVSREGVTGVREKLAGGIPEALARIRLHTKLPVAVGFGISTRAQVAQVAAHADGVVVGSALVNIVREGLGSPAGIAAALGRSVSDLAAGTQRK
ncbi:MAG TPA: tryptophan synthase subunit alpha [Opitutaceae bacterium]|nr:tryptophan synthase subunit alpha [Opitutaceae bacterium]